MKKGTIGGILFLIYFIGVMITIFVKAESEPMIAVMAMGSLFFILGLFALFQKGSPASKLPLLIFPLVGGGMMAVPAVLMYQEKHPEAGQMITEETIPKLILLLFLVVGVCLIIGAVWTEVRQKMTCTEPVEATCIDLVTHRSRKGNRLYAPVWSYYYDGREWIVQDSMASNVGYSNVGETRTIYVNPDDPEKFRRRGSFAFWVILFIGVIFVVMAAFALRTMSNGGMQ